MNEVSQIDKTIGSFITLEEALEDVRKYINFVDIRVRDYAIKKGNLDSDLLHVLNASHMAWTMIDELVDKMFEKKCVLEQKRKKKIKAANRDAKSLADSNVTKRQAAGIS